MRPQVPGSSDPGYQRWPCEDIREVHRRRFELRECAVELFMNTGHTHLITFSSTEVGAGRLPGRPSAHSHCHCVGRLLRLQLF